MTDRLRKRMDAIEERQKASAGGLNWRVAIMPARLTLAQQEAWRAVEVEPYERAGGWVFVLELVAARDEGAVYLQ